MPSVNSSQQRLMGMALAQKRGQLSGATSTKVKRVAKSMSEESLRDFAKTRPRGMHAVSYRYHKRKGM